MGKKNKIKLETGTVYQKEEGGTYYFRYQVNHERKCVSLKTQNQEEALKKAKELLPIVQATTAEVISAHVKVARNLARKSRPLALKDAWKIYAEHPDFVAYGRSGFKGYAVFGFTERNLYILESVMPNNATYVLENDWETISQLSKAEILSQELHKARIVHSENWQKNFDKIMEGKNG